MIDVHAALLSRIGALWPGCAARFDASAKENLITDQLALALQRDPQIRSRFLMMPQYKLLDEDRNGDVVTKGFIDIAVFFHPDCQVYLAFECKRLNVTYEGRRRSLAGPYADKGLARYLSAQYARALPLGAMLGYVMDGDVIWALEQLADAVSTRASQLGLDGSLEDLPSVDVLRCFRTRHRRFGEAILLEVRHALLPLQLQTFPND